MRPNEPEEFYIGYLPRAGSEYRKFIRLVIFALLVVCWFVASLIVSNEHGFSTGKFDLNKFTEMEGIVMSRPFAAIKTFYGKDIYGNPVVKTIPLVSYGKFGADAVLQNIAAAKNDSLDNLWVKVRGKLIYKDGVVVMELSEKEKSFLSATPLTARQKKDLPAPIISGVDTIVLRGQIIDPKCYLGVMKPGEGKPHSDCAIRCIAGGIQPLLVIRQETGAETFFILRGKHEEAINEDVLAYVGMPVELKGVLTKIDDWYVLKIDPQTGITPIR